MKGGKSGGDEARPKPARTMQMPAKGGSGKGRPISPTHLTSGSDECCGTKGAHGGGKDAC